MRGQGDLPHSASSISLRELGRDSRPPDSGTSSSNVQPNAGSGSESESDQLDEDTTDQSRHSEAGAPETSDDPSHDGSPVSSQAALPEQTLFVRFKKLWGANVSCEVDLSACRDHLALERTFLGYLRTSMTMSMMGTVIAQLFSINSHDSGFGYTLVGKPLAAVCFAFSICTIILGAIRSWRIQRAIIDGKALSSGFEVHLLGIAVALLLLVFFGFLIAIDVVKITSAEGESGSRSGS